MDATEVLAQSREAITVKRVFGDPIERDGTIVVPVARVMGGSGFGSGTTAPAGQDPDDSSEVEEGVPSGSGAGFGVWATPAGVYVIQGGTVRWQPAVSPERMVLAAGVAMLLTLCGVRTVLKALVRR